MLCPCTFDGFLLVLTRATICKVTSTTVGAAGFCFSVGAGISFGGRATYQVALMLRCKVALCTETAPGFTGCGALFLDVSPLLTDYALAIRAFLGVVFDRESGTS
jgi:hypothetical protein